MDPLSRLDILHLRDPLPAPVDLTEQISEASDLVKKKPSWRSRTSGSVGSARSPRSGFEGLPLSASQPNGLGREPAKTASTCAMTGEVAARDAGKRRGNGAGLREGSCSPSPVAETLLSECSGSGEVECVSSDDSNVIAASSGASQRRRPTENKERKKVCSSPNQTEWDVLQDSDSVESRTVPSTSEAENAEYFKPTQNGAGSSSSSSSASASASSSASSSASASASSGQKRAPETKKTRNQQHTRSPAGKKATASAAKRRRKKRQHQQPLRSRASSSSPAFPSREPEIKLKYGSCKEAKRDGRGSAFAPYVRVEFSACTVVNFEEDGDFQVRKRQRPAAAPGIVPTTSCLQLRRLGSEVRSPSGEPCCLCGGIANAAGLGDLHGPYHSRGPDRKTSAELLTNGHGDGGAKRKRASEVTGEHWVHEDCCIWSAGVFLVKGRLYGLDEALRLAQKAVCSCCLQSGATLGCFSKGCPNKYHFPCALHAGCVFNEENFTLRCPKHKCKPGLGVSRLQNR